MIVCKDLCEYMPVCYVYIYAYICIYSCQNCWIPDNNYANTWGDHLIERGLQGRAKFWKLTTYFDPPPSSSDGVYCKGVYKEQVKDLHSLTVILRHAHIYTGKEKETICELSE